MKLNLKILFHCCSPLTPCKYLPFLQRTQGSPGAQQSLKEPKAGWSPTHGPAACPINLRRAPQSEYSPGGARPCAIWFRNYHSISQTRKLGRPQPPWPRPPSFHPLGFVPLGEEGHRPGKAVRTQNRGPQLPLPLLELSVCVCVCVQHLLSDICVRAREWLPKNGWEKEGYVVTDK